jgi:P4 family phage/plasmid primase-like protien
MTKLDYQLAVSESAKRFIKENPDFVYSKDKVWYHYDRRCWVESDDLFDAITLKIWEEDELLYNVHLQNLRNLCRMRCAVNGEMNKDAEMLLNTENGILDLQQFLDRTEGTSHAEVVEPHDKYKDRLITMKAGANYKQGARLPEKMLEFLYQLCCGDLEMVNFILMLMAYCLTGRNNYPYFYLLFGLGRNGKSVFLAFMEAFLGSYFGKIPAEKFSARTDAKTEIEVYRNRAKRLVVIDETPDKFKPNTTVLKALTGGDSFTAPFAANRHVYHPEFKLMINTNHLPNIGSDQNVGMWERQKILITRPPLPKEERIKEFEKILLREKDEILTCLLENYLQKALSDGLDETPRRMKLAYEYKRFQENPVEYFMDKTLQVSNIPLSKTMWLGSRSLYGDYTQFHLNEMKYFEKHIGFFDKNESNKLLVPKSTETAFSLKIGKFGGFKKEYNGREYWTNLYFHPERVWSENGMKVAPKGIEEAQEQLRVMNEDLFAARRQQQELMTPLIQAQAMVDMQNNPVDHFEDPEPAADVKVNNDIIKTMLMIDMLNKNNKESPEQDAGIKPKEI